MTQVCDSSVICERLLSDAKYIMTDDLHHMDSRTLEMLLFLKLNKELWVVRTIDFITNKDEEVHTLPGQKHANGCNDDTAMEASDLKSTCFIHVSFEVFMNE